MSLQKKTKAVNFILACFYDQPVNEVQRNALINKKGLYETGDKNLNQQRTKKYLIFFK